MRYHFIREHDREFRVTALCRVLSVSRSGYYGWRTREVERQDPGQRSIVAAPARDPCAFAGELWRRETWQTLTEAGETCGLNRVARLRQAHGIEAKRMRRFHSAAASA